MLEQDITIDQETCTDMVFILHQIIPDLPLKLEERNNQMSLILHLKKYSDGAFNLRIVEEVNKEYNQKKFLCQSCKYCAYIEYAIYADSPEEQCLDAVGCLKRKSSTRRPMCECLDYIPRTDNSEPDWIEAGFGDIERYYLNCETCEDFKLLEDPQPLSYGKCLRLGRTLSKSDAAEWYCCWRKNHETD
jgi:hypothetical protein